MKEAPESFSLDMARALEEKADRYEGFADHMPIFAALMAAAATYRCAALLAEILSELEMRERD